jgi:hypothetical protein
MTAAVSQKSYCDVTKVPFCIENEILLAVKTSQGSRSLNFVYLLPSAGISGHINILKCTSQFYSCLQIVQVEEVDACCYCGPSYYLEYEIPFLLL